MKKNKKLKIILISVAAVLILAAGLTGLRTLISNSKTDNTTYTANQETYKNVIEISGTISAAEEQSLQALSDGTVMQVYVSAGDKVKKGDIILQMDDTTEQYNLAKHDYDMATTKITGSAKELQLMETQRLSLLQKVADRKVVATFDGVIADLDVAVGDSLEAKDAIGTLVNVDYLIAEVEVAETDVQKLKVGQKVDFSFPAYSDADVEGYVVSWPAIGEVTSRGTTIVKAKVRIDDYPEGILPNFSFTGEIELSPTQTNIVVSKYAVGYEDKKPYVVLERTGEKRFITCQKYGKEYVKVTEGLSGGEILKQLTAPKKSGTNRDRNGPPGDMGGMPPGGGGGFPGGGPGGH